MNFDVAAEMTGVRLYIGRLSDSARDRDVERFFKGYGRIREIVLKNGYGFVVSVLVDFVVSWRSWNYTKHQCNVITSAEPVAQQL